MGIFLEVESLLRRPSEVDIYASSAITGERSDVRLNRGFDSLVKTVLGREPVA
jgi:hypothetical protein